ncbi:hypothetical protein [Paenibacillus periandrae]|uniref:hypothetical protein n=1 Tax=Paenibacillus periandrae TaxID=1761741 RepID=UPI001F09E254|nr:hypothetical protein [Paenibacillus periandrae]
MATTEQFFMDIFGEQHIRFRCIGMGKGKPIDAHGIYNEKITSILQQANYTHEVYFVVNNGGYKNEDIIQFNSVFIDLDCGRDKEGNYHPLDYVKGFKEKKLLEIEQFSLAPSYIVETRNGYHAYWLLHSGASIEQFTKSQERLIAYFDADKVVKKPAQLMRVPGFYWLKDPTNKFMVSIIKRNEVRYFVQDVIDNLPCVEGEVEGKNAGGFAHRNKKECVVSPLLLGEKPCHTLQPTQDDNPFEGLKPVNTKHSNKYYIYNRMADELQERLNAGQITLNDHDDVYEYLKKQDLGKFLGVGVGNVNCLFHHDTTPSASIYVNKENGHYLYKCHSNNCGVFGSIIQIVGRMTNFDLYKTMRFLRNVYRIEYAESDWQKEQKGILDENMRFLLMHGDLKNYYPAIYERINHYLPQLYTFHGYAKDKVKTENFTSVDGEPIFFASNSHIAKLFGKDGSTTNERLALFAYLGLIKKWSEADVPEFLMRQARHEAATKKRKYTINFYSIPAYGEQIFSNATLKAKEFKEKGFTMKGFSRELLLRSLGEEETNRVYPRLEGQALSPFSEELSGKLEKLANILIAEKGWTYEKEIQHMLDDSAIKQSVIETQIKRVLPEMFEKYDLRKTRLNKHIKEQLSISIVGYPTIIMQNEMYENVLKEKRE